MRKFVLSWSFALAAVALVPAATGARPIKQALHPTGVDANAEGMAVASIHAKGNRGTFRVRGRNLKPGTTYGISVAGVRIGSLTTSTAGAGVARFSRPPRGNAQPLGVDPRGKLIEVSDDQGEDVMETEMPDDGGDQGNVQCCLADDDGAECEETTADECTAEGGTNLGAGTCFPNPCPTSPPTPDIQCCRPDDDGPECEGPSARKRVPQSAAPRAAWIWAPAAASRIRARRRRPTSYAVASRRAIRAIRRARQRVSRRSVSSSPRATAPRNAAQRSARGRAIRIRACLRRAARFSTDLKDGAEGSGARRAVDLLVPLSRSASSGVV